MLEPTTINPEASVPFRDVVDAGAGVHLHTKGKPVTFTLRVRKHQQLTFASVQQERASQPLISNVNNDDSTIACSGSVR